MCLLVVFHRARPDAPLIVAANRDEFLARPATAMTVLRPEGPRIVGGRDELAGGTWLAVNQHGVVAGLTNVPSGGTRDPSRRSRGVLPLFLASHRDAPSAVKAFRETFRPADFNPAWLLVGDRDTLFYLDMSRGDAPAVTQLPPGLHILENRALGDESPKVDYVRAALAGTESRTGTELLERLREVLRDHTIPPRPPYLTRPIQTEAACVHAGPYGTRSSTIVTVGERLRVWFTDGPPCTAPLRELTEL